MTWQQFIEDCDRDRLNTILSQKAFWKLVGKPERLIICENKVRCEYGYIGGQLVEKEFFGQIIRNSANYWSKHKLEKRKSRANSLTIVYRVILPIIQNPIICEEKWKTH